MKAVSISDTKAIKEFIKFPKKVYANNLFYRATDKDVETLVLFTSKSFHTHATIILFLIKNGVNTLGRFALIHDRKLAPYVQVGFFEALPGIEGIMELLRSSIRIHFPTISQFVIGLQGHLNYGAGMLLNKFDRVPVFGLPYTPPYYPTYFESCTMHRLISFRYPLQPLYTWAEKEIAKNHSFNGITTRIMNKKNIKEESKLYTKLNNLCFQNHPFWSNRLVEEDGELFYPFRNLLDNENLIFAYDGSKPIGFYLWYPDFNELVNSQKSISFFDVLRFRLKNRISTYRFCEIGVLPDYAKSYASLAMILTAIPYQQKAQYTFCEAGFIFEENKPSMALVQRYSRRSIDKKLAPYRYYALYEARV